MTELKFTIKSILGEEKKVLTELDRLLQHHSYSPEDCDEVKTAVAEACLNAMEHGNLLSPELDVHVHIRIHGDTVEVKISDCGLGPRSLKSNQDESERGWGIFFISTFMDHYDSYFLEKQTIFYMDRKMRKEEGQLE